MIGSRFKIKSEKNFLKNPHKSVRYVKRKTNRAIRATNRQICRARDQDLKIKYGRFMGFDWG